MERLSNWEQRLNDLLASRAGVIFDWGAGQPFDLALTEEEPKSDCIMFAAAVVEAVTGEDFAAPYRGKYDSEESANALIAELGAKNLGDLVGKYLKGTRRADAHRGDLVLTKRGNLAVAFGAVALMVGREYEDGEGLIRIPRSDWRRAFRVG